MLFSLYWTYIFTCSCSLEGGVHKVAEHLVPFATGATQPDHFAHLIWFLHRDRGVENRYSQTVKQSSHAASLSETYCNRRNEVDGQREHFLQLIFAELGGAGGPRQVVTHSFNATHDLFLKWNLKKQKVRKLCQCLMRRFFFFLTGHCLQCKKRICTYIKLPPKKNILRKNFQSLSVTVKLSQVFTLKKHNKLK